MLLSAPLDWGVHVASGDAQGGKRRHQRTRGMLAASSPSG